MPDGSNARESDAFGYTIAFNKERVGTFKFKESYGGNSGQATVKLSGKNVYLTIKYPNNQIETYLLPGKVKLVPRTD